MILEIASKSSFVLPLLKASPHPLGQQGFEVSTSTYQQFPPHTHTNLHGNPGGESVFTS